MRGYGEIKSATEKKITEKKRKANTYSLNPTSVPDTKLQCPS
jgi:hypothetical protein